MPNWCVTNIAVSGDAESVSALSGLLSSIPTSPNPAGCEDQSFGPWWLGKLVAALGGDCGRVLCRGVLIPDAEAPACLCIDNPDPSEEIEPDGDGVLRFSITHAWNVPHDLIELIAEKYPGLKWGFRATDEYNNFSKFHDPYGLLGDKRVYELEGDDGWKDYTADRKEDFIRDLSNATGLDIPSDTTDDSLAGGEFLKRFLEWRNDLPENDAKCDVGYTIWEEDSDFFPSV